MSDLAVRRRRGMILQRERAEDGAVRQVSVLSSFNADLFPPFLAEALDRRGIEAVVTTGPFGQIAGEALNPGSDLYRRGGDVVLIPAAEDMLAGLYEPGSANAEAGQELVAARLEEVESALRAILERTPDATCFVVVFGAASVPNAHVLDPASVARGQRALGAFDDGLRALAEISPRVVTVDWDWHTRARGTDAFTDDRLWYLGRMRLNPEGLAELGDLIARHAAAAAGRARKVAVVDLDGTLWGGVLGEAGVEGIELGDEGAGLAFREFQAELLRLRDAGVVLALSSKNDRDEVVRAFADHPAMLVELSHFAADRINWTDKATGLREIAAELSLGLDSFVFLDDNPVEREWVLQALPDVTVPELPEDPADRPRFLRRSGLFERIALTEADQGRAASYAAQGERGRLRAGMSFEDFLRSLEQEVTIAAVDGTTLPRAQQLCQRTNQFNLTTRRHSAAALEAMLASPDIELYTVNVSDRFGDSGITGLAILELRGSEAEVDTFLLSCRVLGRRVEDALLAFLLDRARERGARSVVGSYSATPRNGQVAGFFPERGFTEEADGRFRLDLSGDPVPAPDEMTVKVNVNA